VVAAEIAQRQAADAANRHQGSGIRDRRGAALYLISDP
jgi:hypothetical protein